MTSSSSVAAETHANPVASIPETHGFGYRVLTSFLGTGGMEALRQHRPPCPGGSG